MTVSLYDREVILDYRPAYLTYFHNLAFGGFGKLDMKAKTVSLVVIKLDKDFNRGLDDVRELILEYN